MLNFGRVMFTPRMQWILFTAVIAVALLGLHADGFRAHFLADDYDWLRIAREDTAAGPLHTFTHSHGGNFYRPIPALGFQLDYRLWQYSPSGYNVHQWVFQFFLVLGIALLIARATTSRWLGFASGLLFALHPAQHEVVTWLAGRPDLYAATFSVWALVAFHAWLTRRQWGWLFGSAALAALGMLSKETAFVLPALAGIIAIPTLRQQRLLWRRVLLGVGVLVLILAAAFAARSAVLTSALGGYQVGGESAGTNFTLSNINRPFTSPFKLVNWDYALERFGNAGMVGMLARAYARVEQQWYVWGVLLAAGVGVLWWRRRRDPAAALVVGGMLWSLVAFIPVYGLSGDVRANLMGTRLLFFASIGYVAVLAGCVGLVHWTHRSARYARPVLVALLAVVAVLLWRTNVVPWRVASDRVKQVREAFVQQLPDVRASGATSLLLRRLPGLYFGAYEYFGPRSVSEMVRSVVGAAEPAGFLVGSRAFSDSPFCSAPVPTASIQTLTWESAGKRFTLAGVPDVPPGAPVVWDFQSGMPEGWSSFGLGAQTVNGGVQFTPEEHGQYLQTPVLPATTGSAYRSLTVRFRLVGEGDFGRRRFRVDWRQNGAYAPGQYVRHAYDGEDEVYSLTIPLCQYLPWALSESVDQLRILPATSGAFTVEQVILSPHAP